MRHITKGPEPAELRAYRGTPGATYDGGNFTPVKDAIRQALLRDQFHVCCYCMQRIATEPRPTSNRPDAVQESWMKVEHWRPQAVYPDQALVWNNLLGACWGGMGLPPEEQHCDTRKGEVEIRLDPQNAAHTQTLSMFSDGRLTSTDPLLHTDLDLVLGLNLTTLRRERAAALEGVLRALRARYKKGPIPLTEFQRLAGAMEEAVRGKLPVLASVARLYVGKRFRGQV